MAERPLIPEFLQYYAGRLNAVEVNNTFHRMPNRQMLARWREANKARTCSH